MRWEEHSRMRNMLEAISISRVGISRVREVGRVRPICVMSALRQVFDVFTGWFAGKFRNFTIGSI